MELIERKLEILYQKAVINKKAYTITKNFINTHKEHVTSAKKQSFEMMVTHLAMFLKRASTNKQLLEIDEAILNNLKQKANYHLALDFLTENFLEIAKVIPTISEKAFLVMHTLNTFFD